MKTKTCFLCKEDLILSSFTVRTERVKLGNDNPAKYQSTCKPCEALRSKLRFFNIDKETFDNLRIIHKDCCAICGLHEAEVRNNKTKYYGLYIDHCHNTGQIRGLLCHNCNLLIGHAKDDVQVLVSAIGYLNR